MSNYFLFNFSKQNNKPNQISYTKSNYSNTLPQNECVETNNGAVPVDKYSGYGTGYTANPNDVLYSIWCSNQNSIAAKFTASQASNNAPETSTFNGPANIFIIRHGEKNSSSPNYCLNNNGIYRACHLINYIKQLAVEGVPISYIVTCNICPYNTPDPSMRPMQTMSMSSFMLNIPMSVYGGSQDFAQVADELFNSSVYNGLNVVICWEHSAIQSLVNHILDAAAIYDRLPSGINNADDFFNNTTDICTDGKYLCTSNSDNFNSLYVPPNPESNTQNYPYWNTNNYNNVYCLTSDESNNNVFKFSITKQPCLTCYPSCELRIGLYQPLNAQCDSSNEYYSSTREIESSCEIPIDWIYQG
jgi:hypothetical protein